MSNISNISEVNVSTSSAKLDGIQFNSIQRGGYNSTTRYVLVNTPWSTLDTNTPLKPAVNAVDIDWNEAVIPYGNLETGDSATVNSTGELLSLISQISKMQQEIHYTRDGANNSIAILDYPQKFYNDLVSNKKVYIDNAPVFYYRKTTDNTNAKTIEAYTLVDYMGVPYADKWSIPITITSGSSGDVWECTEIIEVNIYNYFSPAVLIEVSTTSTTYSSIDISVGDEIITVPINIFTTDFLQSCDILAKVKGGDAYWRLDGKHIGGKYSTGITMYICPMEKSYNSGVNDVYRVNITWDLNAKTITTLLD